ncbi:MAG: ferritin-like protein [Proteobacteria bacterium]|nr:ferritin-like protein [Pseudomonadota bacterium]
MSTPALPALIRSLHDLREHLQAALELEHGTIPPYLAALYSIRPGRNRAAAEIIRTVVVQEMLHMALVANVLNAVGGAPSVAHSDFVPSYPMALPLGEIEPLIVPLSRFSPEAVATFLAIERPVPPPKLKLQLFWLDRAEPVPPGQLANMVRAGRLYPSIGDFYEAIERGLVALEHRARAKDTTIFTGDPKRQLGRAHFYGAGGAIERVDNLRSARSALAIIIRQGEGYGDGTADGERVGDTTEIAHYYRFDQIAQGRRYRAADRPGTPTGDLIDVDYSDDAVFPMADNPSLAATPLGEIRDRATAFAERYTDLLRTIDRGFNGAPDRLFESVTIMFDLRRLAADLLANPLGDGAGHAGPCFEFRADAVARV